MWVNQTLLDKLMDDLPEKGETNFPALNYEEGIRAGIIYIQSSCNENNNPLNRVLPEVTETKPCPFCGNIPTIVQNESHGYTSVICSNTMCSLTRQSRTGTNDRELAVAAWNTRVIIKENEK